MTSHKQTRKNSLLKLIIVYILIAGLIAGVVVFYWLLRLVGLAE